MPRYRITSSVKTVAGQQTYECDAKDEAEAKAIFERGAADFVAEELEVQDSYEPDIEEIDEQGNAVTKATN